MYNVLIADDHAFIRSGIASLIEKQSQFKVVDQTSNGTDTYLRVEQGDIDILIMDLSMPPGESGLITTQRIHHKFPKVKIIILSMHEEQEYINNAMHNGALSYIFKSSPDSELLNALKHVILNQSYVDSNIILTKSDINEINSAAGIDDNLKGFNDLSKREQEVLPFVALGYSNKEIAAKLFISTKTVEAHKAHIVQKLGLKSHADLVRYAIHHHLIDI